MTEVSDLDKKVEEIKKEEVQDMPVEVKCLCVHGKCKEGESECHGGCDSGWSGPHCDTPNKEKLDNVNVDQGKDFTQDSLYKPQQTSEQRITGPSLEE